MTTKSQEQLIEEQRRKAEREKFIAEAVKAHLNDHGVDHKGRVNLYIARKGQYGKDGEILLKRKSEWIMPSEQDLDLGGVEFSMARVQQVPRYYFGWPTTPEEVYLAESQAEVIKAAEDAKIASSFCICEIGCRQQWTLREVELSVVYFRIEKDKEWE